MPRFIFACLLLLNIVLLAWQVGGFDTFMSGHREPARLKNQLNADLVKVVPPPGQAAAPASLLPSTSGQGAPAAVPAPAPAKPPSPPASAAPGVPAIAAAASKAPACIEIGNFSPAEGRRFEAALASLKLDPAPTRRELKEQSSHMVWIPPAPGGKESADRKSAELRRIGVTEYYVLQEGPAQRYGISLGVFKTEDAAKAQLARLAEKGVRSARIVEYKMPFTRLAYQLRGVDGARREALDKVTAGFPRHEEKACEAASPA